MSFEACKASCDHDLPEIYGDPTTGTMRMQIPSVFDLVSAHARDTVVERIFPPVAPGGTITTIRVNPPKSRGAEIAERMPRYSPSQHVLFDRVLMKPSRDGAFVRFEDIDYTIDQAIAEEREADAVSVLAVEPVNGWGARTKTGTVWADGFQEGKRLAAAAIRARGSK